MTISIMLNGEGYVLPHAMSAGGLLAHLQLDARKVAVERNLAIVPRSQHAVVMIEAGDAIEIVTFMGGG